MKKIFIGSAHHIFFAAILLLPISGVCKDSSEPDRYSTPGKTPSVYSAGIFGDANGDDVIDPRDKEYIQEIISKRKVPTRLSDANGDGKIDIQDVEQVELLIKEKQKEIVIIDSTYRVVKIDKPINRIIVLSSGTPAGALRALGGANFMKKIVGINGMMSKDPFFKELHDRPSVGWPTPDYEAIVALKPDLVIASANPAFAFDIVEKMKPFGILVLCLDFQGKPEQSLKELKMIGVVMKRTERATEYVRFCKSSLDMVKDRLSRLDPEKRKKVYCEFIQDYEVLARSDGIIQGAGGSHLFEALFLEDYMEQKRFIVDPEEIIRKNPDVIIKDPHVGVMWSGYAKGWWREWKGFGVISLNARRGKNQSHSKWRGLRHR